jgi:hypothetical protein
VKLSHFWKPSPKHDPLEKGDLTALCRDLSATNKKNTAAVSAALGQSQLKDWIVRTS